MGRFLPQRFDVPNSETNADKTSLPGYSTGTTTATVASFWS
jgi:hypothetical protein